MTILITVKCNYCDSLSGLVEAGGCCYVDEHHIDGTYNLPIGWVYHEGEHFCPAHNPGGGWGHRPERP